MEEVVEVVEFAVFELLEGGEGAVVGAVLAGVGQDFFAVGGVFQACEGAADADRGGFSAGGFLVGEIGHGGLQGLGGGE